jgi:hypothetical protein
MKRWALVTVGLYAAALALAIFPLALVLYGDWWGRNGSSLEEIVGAYRSWGFWFGLAIMAIGQAALLLVPLKITERRLKSRRSVAVPAGVSLLLVALLTFAGLSSILGALFSDDGLDSLWRFASFTITGPENGPEPGFLSQLPARQAPDDIQAVLGSLNLILIFWVFWGLLFWRFARADAPAGMFQRCLNWLLRGSILELLIAVPSHIIVRRRGDCCAPGATFLGIVTGVAVMLLCFGPGVFYLFAQRCRRLEARPVASPMPASIDADPPES